MPLEQAIEVGQGLPFCPIIRSQRTFELDIGSQVRPEGASEGRVDADRLQGGVAVPRLQGPGDPPPAGPAEASPDGCSRICWDPPRLVQGRIDTTFVERTFGGS